MLVHLRLGALGFPDAAVGGDDGGRTDPGDGGESSTVTESVGGAGDDGGSDRSRNDGPRYRGTENRSVSESVGRCRDGSAVSWSSDGWGGNRAVTSNDTGVSSSNGDDENCDFLRKFTKLNEMISRAMEDFFSN